jgi:hypothetical protein
MNFKIKRIMVFSTICEQLFIYKLWIDLLHLSINKTKKGYIDNVGRLGTVVNFRALNQVGKGQ